MTTETLGRAMTAISEICSSVMKEEKAAFVLVAVPYGEGASNKGVPVLSTNLGREAVTMLITSMADALTAEGGGLVDGYDAAIKAALAEDAPEQAA